MRMPPTTMRMTRTTMTDSGRETLILLITAAGSSHRMGGGKKEYMPLGNGTVLSECARSFVLAFSFDMLVVTCPAGMESAARDALYADSVVRDALGATRLVFAAGGATRQESVRNGLIAAERELQGMAAADSALVLVQDGARPFTGAAVIAEVLRAAREHGAAAPAVPPVDTQKESLDGRTISRHLKRSDVVAVQTPQCFDFYALLKAHRQAAADCAEFTDDTEIWDAFANADGTRPVRLTAGDIANKKITYMQDMTEKRIASALHTGFGYDLHPLVAGRALLLGGVRFESDKGEAGHSDGDVLLHAVADALLGASAMGDIGSFFPPEDARWKDADSASLLRTVWRRVTAEGWALCNLDCVIALERPKFLPRRDEVRQSIARILGVPAENVFVKAKTGEKMGEIGRGEAVAAWASCILERH